MVSGMLDDAMGAAAKEVVDRVRKVLGVVGVSVKARLSKERNYLRILLPVKGEVLFSVNRNLPDPFYRQLIEVGVLTTHYHLWIRYPCNYEGIDELYIAPVTDPTLVTNPEIHTEEDYVEEFVMNFPIIIDEEHDVLRPLKELGLKVFVHVRQRRKYLELRIDLVKPSQSSR